MSQRQNKCSSHDNSPRNFAAWAQQYSQATNRSIAGSRLTLPHSELTNTDNAVFLQQAQEWGLQVVDAKSQETSSPYTQPYSLGESDLHQDCTTGKQAMDWAQKHMTVIQSMVNELAHEHNVQELRIAMCLILEPKTAILARLLTQAGAKVGIYSGPETLNTLVAKQLQSEGVAVYANPDWTKDQSTQAALRLLDELNPNFIIDDGASFARLAARERPQLASQLIGVAEETTSGVRAFDAMEADKALPFPVVAVNDSLMKTGFDNTHGTGETCITTVQELLGTHCFENIALTVIGYGPVGRGFALRARSLGAQVTVCDIDSRACLQAVFEGFPTCDLTKSLPTADMVISATGVYHTINLKDMQLMRKDTILGVIGGIANEIALDELPDHKVSNQGPVSKIQVPDGPELTLLASGDGINYTAGGGNPIEIMDLSFAVQLAAIRWLLEHRTSLSNKVYRLPVEVDQQIASIALKARGYEVSSNLSQETDDWQVTRFDRPNGSQS